MTHERDMLKKDVKKISMERDSAYKHLTITTGIKIQILVKFICMLTEFLLTISDKLFFIARFADIGTFVPSVPTKLVLQIQENFSGNFASFFSRRLDVNF